jgi:hypothetical protein
MDVKRTHSYFDQVCKECLTLQKAPRKFSVGKLYNTFQVFVC